MVTLPPGVRLVKWTLTHISASALYLVEHRGRPRGLVYKQHYDRTGRRPVLLAKPVWWHRTGPHDESKGSFPTRRAAIVALLEHPEP